MGTSPYRPYKGLHVHLWVQTVAKDLNLRLLRTNPASGQGEDWTQGLRITSTAPLPALLCCLHPNQ